MDARVLVVDDDRQIREMLQRNLLADGYRVDTAPTGEQALARVRENQPDLVVLDVNMPGMDGFEACRIMRREGFDFPVILLTARGEIEDRVTGLDSGADDYMPKPFEYRELAARLRALARRLDTGDGAGIVRFGDVVVDRAGHIARRGERQIDLTPREFDLLELLVRNARTVVPRFRIIEDVWNDEIDIDSNTVEVYVGYLRKKLEADGEPRVLQTVRGTGYVIREASES